MNFNTTDATLNTAYTYDGDGRRVKTVRNGITTVFVYNAAGQLAAEYSSAAPGSNGTSYLTSDHLGSARIVTDSSGNPKVRRDFLPFGEEIAASLGGRSSVPSPGYGATEGTRQKFTAKERDNESNLEYFGARYFSGAQGRFTSVDPALESGEQAYPQTWNRYAYVVNQPFLYVDPDGELAQWAVGALIGGGFSLASNVTTQLLGGKDFSLRQAGAAFIGGAGTGAITAGTFGIGLIARYGIQSSSSVATVINNVGLGAWGNTVDGAIQRGLTGQNPVNGREIMHDATAGALGAGVGFKVEEYVQLPLGTINALKAMGGKLRKRIGSAWITRKSLLQAEARISNQAFLKGELADSAFSDYVYPVSRDNFSRLRNLEFVFGNDREKVTVRFVP